MHRWRSALHLGMPHTISGALSEVALFAHLQDVQWTGIGDLTGTPASRHVDASGHEVYASIYFVDLDGLPPAGLGAFRPDDDLEIVSALGRYGQTMLEAEHALFPRGTLPPGLPDALPPGARVRLSNVLVALGSGPEDLRIATPANARLDAIPALPARPDSYRLIREAEARGSFGLVPPDARRLFDEVPAFTQAVNPDRDLNGVGLLYFANYVAFMDAAERAALAAAGYAPSALDGRTTVRRRIGFYGNARGSDVLRVEVEAFAIADARLAVDHRIRRASDGRLIAIASAEKRLRAR